MKTNKSSSAVILICLALLSACGATSSHGPSTKTLGSFRPAQSCDDIKSYVQNFVQRAQTNPDGVVSIAQPVSAPVPASPMGEAGDLGGSPSGAVTQSDIAFPDTARGLLFAFDANKNLRVFQVSPAAETRDLSTFPLDFYPAELLPLEVDGKYYAVIFGNTQGVFTGGPIPVESFAPIPTEEGQAVMALLDVSNPQQPVLLKEEKAPGRFLEARALSSGKILWVTEHHVPTYLNPLPSSELFPQKSVRQNGNATQTDVFACQQAYLYENASLDSGYAPASLSATVVSLLELHDANFPVHTQAIFSPAWRSLISANASHLFLAQNVDGAGKVDSELYQFDLASPEEVLTLSASAPVPGNIPNQFFIDEKNGALRVFHQVSSFSPCIDCAPQPVNVGSVDSPVAAMKTVQTTEVGNYLSVYKQNGTALELISRSGPFESDETSYAARFVGNLGCVITFRQIDPLTCFELSDPNRPRRLGSLKISGVSFHLEALNPNLLLGIGQGEGNGSVVANLFDISNPIEPKLAAQRLLSQGLEWAWSPVFYDYRALGKDAALRNFSVPMDHGSGTMLSLFSVDPETKQIIAKGSVQQAFGADGSYISYRRGYFFEDTLAALATHSLEVFNRSNLNRILNSSLD